MRAGAAGQERVAALAGLGLIYGTAGVALIAVLAWCVAAVVGAPRPLLWTMTAFALAYTPALLYGVCGLIASLLLKWNTASTFGVTGILWALGPVIAATRDLLPGRTAAGLVLATVVGGLVLLGWAVLAMGG